MRLARHDRAADLLAAAGPYLLATEDTNALLYGIVNTLAAVPELPPDHYLASLHGDADAPVGAALLTPPFVMVMTALGAAAQALLVEDLRSADITPNGVLGPEPDVGAFAERWAALVGETPRSARIGFVYTPPRQRGRGFASSCIAAVSQHFLDAGKRFCCLNADLANPASNAVYRRVGYHAVSDLQEITFSPA